MLQPFAFADKPRKEYRIPPKIDATSPDYIFKCKDCGLERLLMFSCHGRGFCPSCHAKRREEWGEWMRESLLLDVHHLQVVKTPPLGSLSLRERGTSEILQGGCRQRAYARGYRRDTVVWKPDKSSPAPAFSCFRGRFRPGGVFPLLSLKRLSFDEADGKVCYQYGKDSSELERIDYLEFIARVTSHIPDKGQVMLRYYGIYANAHRGKIKKARDSPSYPRIIEEEERFVPSKGWAEMIKPQTRSSTISI